MNVLEKGFVELSACTKLGTYTWQQRHLNAWRFPVEAERPIKELIDALHTYGRIHYNRLGRTVGEDMFLGPAFKQIAEAVLILLNGDLGRFDGGTLDSLVRAICTENGVELDQ